MSYHFTLPGKKPVDLDVIANQLRKQIDALKADLPQLAKQLLDQQTGVMEVLVVVRGHELPHTHPQSDLLISVLEGGGYVQLSGARAKAPAGTTVVIPKGVCHAYHNLAKNDSVLFATFSPAEPTPGECAKN